MHSSWMPSRISMPVGQAVTQAPQSMQSPAASAFVSPAAQTRFAAPALVGHGDALLVQHRGLEARPRAHVGADLLACPAGQQVRRGGEQEGEEIHLVRRGAGPEFHRHGRRIDVVHDPRAAGPERDAEPDGVLRRLAPGGVETQRLRVALHAFVAVAFDQVLDPHEQIGPHRLRTGVAAPDAAEQAGDQEQRDRAHDQKAGQVIDVLRPEFEIEEVEALVPDREQHRLIRLVDATMPAQPGQQIVDAETDDQHRPFEPAYRSAHRLRIDLHAIGEQVVAGLLALELKLTVGLADAGHRLPAATGRGPGTCRCHRLRTKAISVTSTVMAGPVPAIRSGRVPRPMAGTGPAMTVRAGFIQRASTFC